LNGELFYAGSLKKFLKWPDERLEIKNHVSIAGYMVEEWLYDSIICLLRSSQIGFDTLLQLN